MTQDQLDKIRAKVRELLRVGKIGMGTDAETTTALNLAASLMRQYGLTEDEVNTSPWSTRELIVPAKVLVSSDGTWAAIGRFCEVQCYVRPTRPARTVVYFGREPDVEIAEYLHDICVRAIIGGLDEFRRSAEYRRKRKPSTRAMAASAFSQGMAARLISRLKQLKRSTWRDGDDERIDEKLRRVTRELAERGVSLRTAPLRLPKGSKRLDHLSSGWQAGGAAPLNAGVGDTARGPIALLPLLAERR